MARVIWRLGDTLNVLHRRYGAGYTTALLALGWLVASVAGHFGGAAGSPIRPHPWSSAALWGFVLTCIVFLLVRLIASRR